VFIRDPVCDHPNLVNCAKNRGCDPGFHKMSRKRPRSSSPAASQDSPQNTPVAVVKGSSSSTPNSAGKPNSRRRLTTGPSAVATSKNGSGNATTQPLRKRRRRAVAIPADNVTSEQKTTIMVLPSDYSGQTKKTKVLQRVPLHMRKATCDGKPLFTDVQWKAIGRSENGKLKQLAHMGNYAELFGAPAPKVTKNVLKLPKHLASQYNAQTWSIMSQDDKNRAAAASKPLAAQVEVTPQEKTGILKLLSTSRGVSTMSKRPAKRVPAHMRKATCDGDLPFTDAQWKAIGESDRGVFRQLSYMYNYETKIGKPSVKPAAASRKQRNVVQLTTLSENLAVLLLAY
jgi:hypothetical protein